MDYDKLIDDLRNNNIENNCHDCALGYYAFESATAIETLLVENQALRNAANGFKADLACATAERDAAVGCLKNKCPFCRKYLTCQGRTINNDCWEFFGSKED